MIPPRIKSIKLYENYNIEIEYVNNEKKLYNMQNMLSYAHYKKLKDLHYFMQAKSAETTIEWPDGEDIDSSELYLNSKSI